MLRHPKKSNNLAHLENGTYNQIVAHLKKGTRSKRQKNDGELSIPSLTVKSAMDIENKPEFSKKACFLFKDLGCLLRDGRKRTRKKQEQKQTPLKM